MRLGFVHSLDQLVMVDWLTFGGKQRTVGWEGQEV
jgi:hypothetical protein